MVRMGPLTLADSAIQTPKRSRLFSIVTDETEGAIYDQFGFIWFHHRTPQSLRIDLTCFIDWGPSLMWPVEPRTLKAEEGKMVYFVNEKN